MLRRSFQLVSLSLLVPSVVLAIPAFHTVNDVDLDGQTCPLVSVPNLRCPPLCVRSLDLCPDLVAPQCPDRQVLCLDGTCRHDCDGVTNICNCLGNTKLVPCMNLPFVQVTVDKFNVSTKDTQVQDACNQLLGVTPTPGKLQWETCSSKSGPEFTFKEPMWIAVFSILGIELGLLMLWSLYKRLRERGIESLLAVEESPPVTNSKEKMESTTTIEEGFPVKGFENDLLGTLIASSLLLISVGWLVYLAVITADYYGAIDGDEYGIAHGSYDLSSNMFIGIWITATSWFVTLNVFQSKLRNYFRIQVNPRYANVVQIEQLYHRTIMLNNHSQLLAWVHYLEAKLVKLLGWHIRVTTCPIYQTHSGLLYFNYQCRRYVYCPEQTLFRPYEFNLGTTGSELLGLADGLSVKEANRRWEVKGPNFINVHVPSFPVAFAQEITGFFYLYQLMIMWLFYYLSYWVIGVVDTAVIFASALTKVIVRLHSEHRVKRMAEHQDQVQVLRDNVWVEIPSSQLVPGDIFQLENKKMVPCDGILLCGNAVVDESSLTGEPLPIRKFPIRKDSGFYDKSGSSKINSLSAGTIVKQITPEPGKTKVRCLVYQTATATDKGQLVHKILFPNPVSFIFDEQLKVVVMILGMWGLVLFGMALWLMQKGGSAAWFYGMLCLAQILSPILPAALVVGQSVAANELRKHQIFCVDLPRIMMAGKIQMFCFDKTGTLTKEGLDFYGGQPINNKKLGQLFYTSAECPDLFQLGLATCHSVTRVDGSLIGNPVDIEMFEATKWDLHDKSDYLDTIQGTSKTAHIIKRFEFIHARASMSVAVLDETTKRVHVFVKGSFEKLKCLSKNIPEDYDQTTAKLASEGCYVLGLAHCDLGEISLEKVQNMTREELEADINMLGLVIFKNFLKDDTEDAITQLKNGNTRTVMITGDTALTGIYIARTCGLMPSTSQVYLGDIHNNEVMWVDIKHYTDNYPQRLLDTNSVRSLFPPDGLGSTIELAVTGRAFNLLCDRDDMRDILLNTRVFARMLPQDKVDCIQLHMERGITAMCGDGGNDCGALRAAHVGIALSEAEASIVSAFSSSFRSVASCVELIRQGRAALATSFAGYKYLILYGETMAFLKLHTFYFSISPSQNLWILIDAFITVGLTFALTQSKAASHLTSQRPTARLLGPETLASTLGQIFINASFLMGAFGILFQQSFFKCHEFDASTVDLSKWYLLGDNFESQVLSFMVLIHFVNSGFVFNFGYKFRQGFYKNYLLLILWAGLLSIIYYVLLADPNWLGCMLRLNCGNPDTLSNLGYSIPNLSIPPYNIPLGHNVFPPYFRYLLGSYMLINMVVGILWESLVVLGPIRNYCQQRYRLNRLTLKL